MSNMSSFVQYTKVNNNQAAQSSLYIVFISVESPFFSPERYEIQLLHYWDTVHPHTTDHVVIATMSLCVQ